MSHRNALVAWAVWIAFLPALVSASESPPDPDTGVDWQLEIAPYLWLMSADGNAQLGPVRFPVSISFGEIFKRLNIAGMLEMDARWRRWLVKVDGRYASLTDGSNPSYDLDQATVEFAVGRRMWTYPLGDPAEGRDVHVDLLAGGRWWWTKQTIRISGLKLRREKMWVDPLVGARVQADVTSHWIGEVAADFGGFGAGSQFAWNVLGQVGYRLTPRWTAELSFRALGVDFKTGRGAAFFLTDLAYWGPMLGIRYRLGGSSP